MPDRAKTICYLGLSRWPDGPGDPRIFQKQLLSLASIGYGITALITGSGKEYLLNGYRVVPMAWGGGLLRRLFHLAAVYRAGRRYRSDCYMFGNFELIPVALLLKITTGAKVVYDAMEHYPDMMRVSRQFPRFLRPMAAFLVDIIEIFSSRFFDLMMTADEPTMSRFRASRNMLVNYNFPQVDVFDNFDSGLLKNLKEKYRGYRIVAYVGSMGWDRGLREMAGAMAIVHRLFPQVKLLLLGGWQFPQWREEFVRILNDRNLNGFVELVGMVPQSQLGAYLRLAEIGLAPLEPSEKHQKNIATKQFDYMCCSIPVVANNLAPFRAFLGLVNAGIITNTDDEALFAKAISDLLSDPDTAIRMGQNGRDAVLANWNWRCEEEEIARAFASMWRDVSDCGGKR